MEHNALIVAHGQPSDPAAAGAELAALAALVGTHLPGWHVGAATLAEPGALAEKLRAAGPQGLVYPLFMACGWFTRTHLPARMAEAGAAGWRILPPFGCDAGVQALTVTLAQEAAASAGVLPAAAAVLVAAHGSSSSDAPALISDPVAHRIAQAGFARAEAAFIDQTPRIAATEGFGRSDFCLPYFAAKGGHVTDDIPDALSKTGFAGRLLPPVGGDARVPALIARALRDAADHPERQCAGVICARLA